MRSASVLQLVEVAFYVTCFFVRSSAFPVGLSVTRASHSRTSTARLMVGSGDNPLANGELTSALARLDRQWKIQQRTKGGQSRWTKLVLPKEDQEDTGDLGDDVIEKEPFADTPFATEEDFVYLLEPKTSIPSSLIVFVGGAGLGQFPHIAYSEFLMRVSDKLNAAVLAAPYQVGLNHFDIAKATGERLRKALIHCEDDPTRQYPSTLPTYCLAHSLGAKLLTIYMAATGQEYDGVGYLSYNNFSFTNTVAMARTFAQQMRGSIGVGRSMGSSDALNGIFDLAESAIGALGFDFSPAASDMNRLIELKYTPDLQRKTRLFVFDEDTLDSSQSFLESCGRNENKLSVSGLPGTHLTPVYFKFGLDNVPEEARSMAADAMGGVESASFGNGDELDSLVQEVCGWILGKEPSRGPKWGEEAAATETDFRLSAGEATDSR